MEQKIENYIAIWGPSVNLRRVRELYRNNILAEKRPSARTAIQPRYGKSNIQVVSHCPS